MKQASAPIVSTIEVMPETYLVGLEVPRIAAAARPGQFIMVRCGGGTTLPRPFSVHRVDGNKLALLFQIVGKGTRWLAQRKTGETLDIFGPLGNGFTLPDTAQSILLAAGGIGIAPLRFLADSAIREGKKVTLITGARTGSYLLPVATSQDFYNEGGLPASLDVVNATDDGSEGFRGPATDLIPAYLDGVDQVFACGPAAMYRTMSRMPELKNRPVQVSLEIVMGCGAGVCYGCTIRTKHGLKQVCRDGPVFDLGDIIWEKPAGP
ncbi:MAG: dihydroorotate dehydrogenase electron transfer subunit [Chloroflexota bacterium]